MVRNRKAMDRQKSQSSDAASKSPLSYGCVGGRARAKRFTSNALWKAGSDINALNKFHIINFGNIIFNQLFSGHNRLQR